MRVQPEQLQLSERDEPQVFAMGERDAEPRTRRTLLMLPTSITSGWSTALAGNAAS
jgi:hypothetical protein